MRETITVMSQWVYYSVVNLVVQCAILKRKYYEIKTIQIDFFKENEWFEKKTRLYLN